MRHHSAIMIRTIIKVIQARIVIVQLKMVAEPFEVKTVRLSHFYKTIVCPTKGGIRGGENIVLDGDLLCFE